MATRGLQGLLLIDGSGRPCLVPWGEPVEAAEAATEEEPIVRVRTYTLSIDCGPCKTSGPHAGKRLCCEPIGGDYICRWVRC